MLSKEFETNGSGFLLDAELLPLTGASPTEVSVSPDWLREAANGIDASRSTAVVAPSARTVRTQAAGELQIATRVDARSAARLANGPAAWMSLPCYLSGQYRGTLAIAMHSVGGTAEVWIPREGTGSEPQELRFGSGHFAVNERFLRLSVISRFRRGEGLPGGVWSSGRPVLFEDLSLSSAFLRAEAALSVGLRVGLGLPISTPRGESIAVLLLAPDQAAVRSIQIFRERDEVERLHEWSRHGSPAEKSVLDRQALELAEATRSALSPVIFKQKARPSEFAFSWPSLDRDGVLHVVTVVV